MTTYSRRNAEEDLSYIMRSETSGATKNWLEGRPRIVQDLYKQYPPNQFYCVKAGAPYSVTCAGCIVAIASYLEDGTVRLNLLKDLSGLRGPGAIISPEWLQPISIDEAFPEPN